VERSLARFDAVTRTLRGDTTIGGQPIVAAAGQTCCPRDGLPTFFPPAGAMWLLQAPGWGCVGRIWPGGRGGGSFGTQRSGVQLSPTRHHREGLVTGPLRRFAPDRGRGGCPMRGAADRRRSGCQPRSPSARIGVGAKLGVWRLMAALPASAGGGWGQRRGRPHRQPEARMDEGVVEDLPGSSLVCSDEFDGAAGSPVDPATSPCRRLVGECLASGLSIRARLGRRRSGQP
jgi:hypothetical protein